MNVKLLIDTIIQQTTVLIAQLATTAGLRAPLSHVANQVFLELARELEGQGVSKKVAADMFGMALRSYQKKVQRLSEVETHENISLWEAIFAYIQENDVVSRAEVLRRFHREDLAIVKGILADLVGSNLVFHTGQNASTVYRIVSDAERQKMLQEDRERVLPWFVWSTIYRHGMMTREALERTLTLEDPGAIDRALEVCLRQGHIQERQGAYSSETWISEVEASEGWEAALADHLTAMVNAVCNKLREIENPTLPPAAVGGSTYYFDVGPEHPFEARVLSLLATHRAELSELREQVTSYNDQHGRDQTRRVIHYLGQAVIDDDA